MIRFRNNYPVIILATDGKSDLTALRHDLSGTGIYCHTFDFNEAKNHLSGADVLVVVSDMYSSPAASLIHTASQTGTASVLYVGSPADVKGAENVSVICSAGGGSANDDNSYIASALSELMREKYKTAAYYAEDDEILCELTKPAQVYYNGTKLPLSKSEAKIVHFLLTVERGSLVSKEVIGEYLGLAPGAIPVHIHNINDKSMKIYHDKLIFSRSSRGYFVY